MKSEFEKAGITLTEEQEKKFLDLTAIMSEYNTKTNLTAIKEETEIVQKHYIDSVIPLTKVNVPRGTRFLDIGAGAGFPSLPMLIIRPDIKFTLLDSLNKRIVYLSYAAEKLGIECSPIHGRAEELGRNPMYREQYDFVTARAVASLPVLCEYALPFLKVGGSFLAMKGPGREDFEDGVKLLSILGGEVKRTEEYSLPNGDRRTLYIIEKTKPTLPKYPRAGGKAGTLKVKA